MRSLALLPLLAFLLAGCIESEEAFVLKANGSGTVRQSYAVDLRARLELAQMAAVLYGGSLDPKDLPYANPVAPEWIEALADRTAGYTVKKAEQTETKDKRTSIVEASFANLEAAAAAGAFFTSSIELERQDEETWKLTLRDAWKAASGRTPEELGGQNIGALLKGFEGQLKGLAFRRTITVPTKVIATNGDLDERGFTVNWKVDFLNLLEGKDLVLTITFRHEEGLDLKPFRHKPQPQALMVRCLEAPPGATSASRDDAPDADDPAETAEDETVSPDETDPEAPTR